MQVIEPWFSAPAVESAEYLLERMEMSASVAGLTGLSSDALVFAALTGVGPYKTDYPSDRTDWRRCLLAYVLAPEWLRERMRPILRLYRAELRENYRHWSPVWTWPKLDAAHETIGRFHATRAENSQSETK